MTNARSPLGKVKGLQTVVSELLAAQASAWQLAGAPASGGNSGTGFVLALGGNTLHRAPMAFVRELVRQGARGLRVVKTAGAHDVDLLARAGALASVDAGFVGYETGFGLARYYRAAVESGQVLANEHACYTVMCALRAAATGVGFMPVKGLSEGELLQRAPYFKRIQDPFTGELTTVVKAIAPDVAVIHVQAADLAGNGWIEGPHYDDDLLIKSAKRVIVTTERLVDARYFERNKLTPSVAGFLVDQVVLAPKGAAPCAVYGQYDVDAKALSAFLEDPSDKALSEKALAAYLERYLKADRQSSTGGVR